MPLGESMSFVDSQLKISCQYDSVIKRNSKYLGYVKGEIPSRSSLNKVYSISKTDV